MPHVETADVPLGARRWVPARVGLPALLVCLGLVAYPRPRLLARTLHNALHPEIDAESVRRLADALPDDPDAVRGEVLTHVVPFASDWDVFGVPYYFPTLAEVLERGRGDCKSQALVLGSLLLAKGVPFQLLASLDHVWPEYPGKAPTAMEDPAVAVAEYRAGRWRPLRPARLRLRSHVRVSADEYWRGASKGRRAVFTAGLLLLVTIAARRG